MLKANHQAVAHQANIGIVALRNFEIGYYNQFFGSFGLQAALIAGFTISSLSSVIGIGAACNEAWMLIFWLASAVAFVGSMHVLLCVMFLAVYGQGLALRGPTGSMARAVDGMIIEQNQVMFAFHISFVAFGISNIGCYGIMMDLWGAVISSAITVAAMYIWYAGCARIYNRFAHDPVGLWHSNNHFRPPNRIELSLEPMTGHQESNGNQQEHGIDMTPTESFSLRESQSPFQRSSFLPMSLSHSGYLTCHHFPQSSVSLSSSSLQAAWRRLFVVIVDNKLYYYNDNKSYQDNPESNCLRKRPVLLENYVLSMECAQPPYSLALTPLDIMSDLSPKVIGFRCDTMAELAIWFEILSKAINLMEKS